MVLSNAWIARMGGTRTRGKESGYDSSAMYNSNTQHTQSLLLLLLPLHLLPDSFDDIDVKSKWIDMFFGCVIRTCGRWRIPTTINISVNGRNNNVVVLVDKAVYVSPTLHADYHKMNMLYTVLASHLAHQDTECTYMLRREPKANARHHKLHYISLSLFLSLDIKFPKQDVPKHLSKHGTQQWSLRAV